jgi:hypothetical protein
VVIPIYSPCVVLRRFALLCLVSAAALLSGCGSGITGSFIGDQSQIQGTVQGGRRPVVGATIQFYSASANGTSTSATTLLSSPLATDSAGSFSLPQKFKCTNSTDQIYVVATGGNSSAGTNSSLALMADLGNCGNITSSTPIYINEVTTIASVYALAQFMTPGSYSVVSSSTDASTVAAAYTAASTLVDFSTGVALTTSAVQAKLNSLSDSVASCIDSAGGSAACNNLFADATPPGSSAKPTSTIAAILNIARNPTNNVDNIYTLASATPFQPALTAAPSDWTLFGSPAPPAPPAPTTPTINWATPAAITYGTPLTAAQLNATASVPGSFAYSPAAGTIPATGTDTLSVMFTPADTSTYTTATAKVSLVVNKAMSTINWATPAAITSGTALSGAQLNATASVPGSFAYSPSAGTIPAVGTDPLSVTFTPQDAVNYTGASKSVSLVVTPPAQTTPTISWATPAAIAYGTTLSATQLNATASVPGSFSYSPAAGTTPQAGSRTLSVTFTPQDTTTYTSATANVSLVVNKATPTINWATPAPVSAGTALSGTQLNATASVPGSFVYSPSAGTIPAAGTNTLNVTFTPQDTGNYTGATKSVSLVVNAASQITPTITWATPAAITYGTALSATQLNATASVPGSFSYSPAAGTTPAAGTYTLSVTFTPQDATTYTGATAAVSLVVNKATPTINWATPAAITAGTTLSGAQLNATASVPGSFSYSPAAGTTPPVGTTTLSTTFTPQDTANYTGAAKSVSLVVNPAAKTTPTINWATPAAITYGTTLSAVQLNAAASVPGSFAYSPAAGTTPATGTNTLSVTFTPTDTTSYNSATATVTMVVNKATPTISWATPAAITAGTTLSGAQLNATALVPGSFAYNPAAGTTPAVGTTTLSTIFTPQDTTNYTSATKSVSLVVNAASQIAPTITWATPAAITYGTTLSATQLNATASVPGTFAYSPAAGSTPAAGSDTLSVTFTPQDTTTYGSATATVSLVVNKATPTITWAAPAAITAGTTLSGTQLNATASVPGSLAYSPAAGTTPAVGTDTLSVTFTPTDTTNYSTATKSVSLVVNPSAKTTPTITWATPAAITYGTKLSSTQLNATASVPGSFAYSPAVGTTPATGTDTLTVTFTPTDTTNYNNATATVSLVVNKATPTITWPTPAAITFGTTLSGTQLNATASVSGSFVYSPAAGTTPVAGTDTLSVTFTPTDTTNYTNATATVSLVVNGGTNPSTTNIDIGTTVTQSGLKRLGMNIAGQDFYDSGQMLRNLAFKNPGFEGETWQSILHCAAVTATSCTDGNQYAVWPANFLQGATFEFVYGAAVGETGVITSNTAAVWNTNSGITINFAQLSKAPAVGDFVVVKMNIPGNAAAGWWQNTSGGATLTTDFSDLSPNSPGKQALQINAAGSGQSADVHSYFDGAAGRDYVLLNGTYRVAFRAKGLGGNNQMSVSVARLAQNGNFFSQTVTLTNSWKDYTFDFSTAEVASTVGVAAVDLHFGISGANVLLDDVSLTPAVATAANPTPFRDEVVSTLIALHPGSLRYMDSGTNFGSSIDNMIAPPFARQRAGSSTQSTEQDDIPLGLHEFLQLCQTVGAEPWYNMPPAMSPAEMQKLVEYLGGDASTPYGAKRAALGQIAPWTSVFPVIHLELGNEQWNYPTFPGNAINDPAAFGNRNASIFGAARSSPSFNPAKFDLVLGSFIYNPWYTGVETSNSSNYDSISVAPYIFDTLNDTSSNEAIFGPMFAQPEMMDSVPSGYMYQQSQAAKSVGKNLVVYEENIGTLSGTASQNVVNAVIPSVAGGIAMADHMLLMMRDLGVKTQNVWSLPGISNQFTNTNGGSEISPLFGTVIDMGGQTNLRRPVFLAEQLTNTAILPNMLATTLSGANPTWNQPLSTNDNIQLNNAHELQTFAFTDGANNRSLVLVNLSRTSALPVTFSGANAPIGSVVVGLLTSASLTDTNENSATVNITNSTITNFQPSNPYSLPPFSLTVLTWQTQ